MHLSMLVDVAGWYVKYQCRIFTKIMHRECINRSKFEMENRELRVDYVITRKIRIIFCIYLVICMKFWVEIKWTKIQNWKIKILAFNFKVSRIEKKEIVMRKKIWCVTTTRFPLRSTTHISNSMRHMFLYFY